MHLFCLLLDLSITVYKRDHTLAGALEVMTMDVFASALLIDQTMRSARVKLLGVRHRLFGFHQRRLVRERLKSILGIRLTSTVVIIDRPKVSGRRTRASGPTVGLTHSPGSPRGTQTACSSAGTKRPVSAGGRRDSWVVPVLASSDGMFAVLVADDVGLASRPSAGAGAGALALLCGARRGRGRVVASRTASGTGDTTVRTLRASCCESSAGGSTSCGTS
jgi:hypothetical protein